MKVYVIEKGWYSDRTIIGVTESEEIAKRIVTAYNYGNDTFYRIYDTNQFQDKPFRFIVNYAPGISWDADVDQYGDYSGYDKNTMINVNEYVVFSETKEQAIKIAQDMRAEYKAREAGII